MKLGSKKTKQAELLDALGGDVLATTSIAELSAPAPAAPEPPAVQKVSGRGSLPEVEAERCVFFPESSFCEWVLNQWFKSH